MKRIIALLFVFFALSFTIVTTVGHTFTFNGASPGSTASGTPVAVGTSTPVAVVACGPTLNGQNGFITTLYLHMCVTGGTSGTDGCYVLPATTVAATPCPAASPAPNASTQVGLFIPTGGTGWTCQDINYPSAGGANWLTSRWDAVCTAGSMKMSVTTLP